MAAGGHGVMHLAVGCMVMWESSPPRRAELRRTAASPSSKADGPRAKHTCRFHGTSAAKPTEHVHCGVPLAARQCRSGSALQNRGVAGGQMGGKGRRQGAAGAAGSLPILFRDCEWRILLPAQPNSEIQPNGPRCALLPRAGPSATPTHAVQGTGPSPPRCHAQGLPADESACSQQAAAALLRWPAGVAALHRPGAPTA